MTVVTLNRDFLLDYINNLAPNSRKRPGAVDILRRINNIELSEEQRLNKVLVEALDHEFAPDAPFWLGLGGV